MNKNERESIMRAQHHGWTVSYVGPDLVLMRPYWLNPKTKHIYLAIWPDGRVTAHRDLK